VKTTLAPTTAVVIYIIAHFIKLVFPNCTFEKKGKRNSSYYLNVLKNIPHCKHENLVHHFVSFNVTMLFVCYNSVKITAVTMSERTDNVLNYEESSLLGYNAEQIRDSATPASASFLLHFGSENGAEKFFRNGLPSLNYTALKCRRTYSS
jgi:hypothetical protein